MNPHGLGRSQLTASATGPTPYEARLREYDALRNEIQNRTTQQQALLTLNLTIAGVVTGVAFKGKSPDYTFFVVVALISPIFGLLWLDHHVTIQQIADYTRKNLWKAWRPSWEHRGETEAKPLWWEVTFVTMITLVFGGLAVAGLGLSFAHAKHSLMLCLWIAAAVFTVWQIAAFVTVLKRGAVSRPT